MKASSVRFCIAPFAGVLCLRSIRPRSMLSFKRTARHCHRRPLLLRTDTHWYYPQRPSPCHFLSFAASVTRFVFFFCFQCRFAC